MKKIELFDHQREVVDRLSNGKILWGGVGTGKSITVLEYYVQNEAPKDIYVITTAKKRDSLEWEGDAVSFGISVDRNLTRYGTLKVDSWNNLKKYTDVQDAYFIFDEQRLVGSGAWTKAFIKIARNNRWNLLTATPGDTWMDYVPVFVANNLYKNRTEFVRDHVVYAPFSKFPKIIRYTGTATLEKWRNLILVEMPYTKHTQRIVSDLETSHDKELMQKAIKERWNVFEDEPIKDIAELFRVMRKITGTDPSRLDTIRDLLHTHDRLIIFYNFNYELDILRQLGDSIEVAEWNGKVKDEIPETKRWVYLVQYVAGAEGWNCIKTDAMVFYSLTYSYKNFEQAQGRIDRLNTPFSTLYYYVLVTDSAIDKAVKDSLKKKEHFNESSYAKQTFGSY